MIFPSFCIRSGLHALRISCPFCVHKNSVNEIQYEFSPTLFIIEPIFMSKRGTKHTLDERVAAVLGVIEKQRTVNTVAKEYEVSKFTIND